MLYNQNNKLSLRTYLSKRGGTKFFYDRITSHRRGRRICHMCLIIFSGGRIRLEMKIIVAASCSNSCGEVVDRYLSRKTLEAMRNPKPIYIHAWHATCQALQNE